MRPILVFDLDGTLVDTAPDLGDATNYVMTRLGRRALTIDEVRHSVGHGARRLIELGLHLTGGGDSDLIDQELPNFLEFYRAHIADRSAPFSGVEATLQALKAQGFRIAVCTNKPEDLAYLLLDKLGLTSLFCTIVGGDTLSVRKPDPTPLLTAIERSGGTKGWMVGDSASDIGAAINANMPSVGVLYGYGADDDLMAKATVQITDFRDLLQLDFEQSKAFSTRNNG